MYSIPSISISDYSTSNNYDKINISSSEYSIYINIENISSYLNTDLPSSISSLIERDFSENLLDEIVMNKTKNEVNEIIPKILSKIKIGEYYKFSGNDFVMTIKPLNSDNIDNSTYVDFSNCEEILRRELNISSSTTLTFLQVEINNINEQSLVN